MRRLGEAAGVLSNVKGWHGSGDTPNMWLTGFHASLLDRIKGHTSTHRWPGTSLFLPGLFHCPSLCHNRRWDALKEENTVDAESDGNPGEPAPLSCCISHKSGTFLWVSPYIGSSKRPSEPSSYTTLPQLLHQLEPDNRPRLPIVAIPPWTVLLFVHPFRTFYFSLSPFLFFFLFFLHCSHFF